MCLTPKPGLVDRRNTGAHDDMDLPLFRRSAAALEPYFCRFVSLGMAGASPAELQALGREAEHAMLTATGGVNTHKGALYSFALLLSALGRSLTEGGDPFHTAAAIADALPPASGTHGSAVRAQCGGVRQEAISGFPTARHMRELLSRSGALAALTWSMSRLDDSTLVYRGGSEGLRYVQQAASALLALPENALAPALEALDDDLIARVHLGQRQEDFPALGADPDLIDVEGHAAGQIVQTLLAGPLFQQGAQVEQEHHRTCGAEIAPQEGGADAQRVQYFHLQPALQQAADAFPDEGDGAPERIGRLNGSRQEELAGKVARHQVEHFALILLVDLPAVLRGDQHIQLGVVESVAGQQGHSRLAGAGIG